MGCYLVLPISSSLLTPSFTATLTHPLSYSCIFSFKSLNPALSPVICSLPFVLIFSLNSLCLMIFPHCNILFQAHKWEKTRRQRLLILPYFLQNAKKIIFFASSLVCIPLFVSCYVSVSYNKHIFIFCCCSKTFHSSPCYFPP